MVASWAPQQCGLAARRLTKSHPEINLSKQFCLHFVRNHWMWDIPQRKTEQNTKRNSKRTTKELKLPYCFFCKVFLYNIPKANDTFTQHRVPYLKSHPGKKPCIRNLGNPRVGAYLLCHRRYAPTHGLRGDLINSTTRTSKCRHFIPFTSSTDIYVNR